MKTPKPVDIIIAGVQKAATSSLQHYMGEHPDVITTAVQEFTYFILEDEWKQGYVKRYQAQFGDYVDNSKKILAKSVGIIYFEHGVKHLKEHNPEVKIIIMLRNPIDRAYSAFWYALWQGHETLETFEETLNADINRADNFISRGIIDYLGRGEYARQIERIYKYFDKSRVLILLEEDIAKTLKTAFEFSGLDASYLPDYSKKYNSSARSIFPSVMRLIRMKNIFKTALHNILPVRTLTSAKLQVVKLNTTPFTPPPMKPETRKFLIDYYKPLNDQLEKLIGRDLSSWNQ